MGAGDRKLSEWITFDLIFAAVTVVSHACSGVGKAYAPVCVY